MVVGAFVVVLVLCAAAFLVFGRGGGGGEVLAVRLQPIGDQGTGPFTSSVVNVEATVLEGFAAKQAGKAPASSGKSAGTSGEPAGGASSGSGLSMRPVAGDAEGLYGVDTATALADGDALATQLSEDAAVASAWASVMDVSTSAIGSSIQQLTPVVLGSDTAVTVHNLVDGQAGAYQAVLQAGTVVFIDAHGAPVIHADSGDPLSRPEASTAVEVTFEGDEWDGFDQEAITAIDPADTELQTIDGVDIHTGEPTTIGVGGTISLDGYLVSDETGVSVVSDDGETTTQIIDHEVGRALGDGMGGVIYEDSLSDSPTISHVVPHSIMWLRAAETEPTPVVEVDPDSGLSLSVLGTGRFNGEPVLFYAKRDNSFEEGAWNQGAGGQLIIVDLGSGEEHSIATAPASDLRPEFIGYLATLGNHAYIDDEYVLFQVTQGTEPVYYKVDSNYEVTSSRARLCDSATAQGSADFSTCGAIIAGPLQDGQAAFYVVTSGNTDTTAALVTYDPAADTAEFRKQLEASDLAKCVSRSIYVGARTTQAVVSFEPSETRGTDCRTSAIDASTGEVTELPFEGLTADLETPVIRPATSDRGASSATAPTTVSPTTAEPSTTTLPAPTTTSPLAATMNLGQIANGDYTSLLGTWTQVALAANPYDGTGLQWQYRSDGIMEVTSDTITIQDSFVIRGNTFTYDVGNGPVELSLVFQNQGRYLSAELASEHVISYSVEFYPRGSVDLNEQLGPNNGVTIDNSKDVVKLRSSNNGIVLVFQRTG